MQLKTHPFNDRGLQSLVDLALLTAGELIDQQWNSAYSYHGPEHTRRVVQSADQLAIDSKIDEEDRATVLIAAAFHDCGFYSDMDDHENIGAGIAADFLSAHDAPLPMINKVAHLIQSTALHARPVTPLQEILRDADLHYLGCEGFLPKAELLRQEWKTTRNLSFSELAWLKQNVKFMESHRYHSPAALSRYGAQKDKNLESLRQTLSDFVVTSENS